MPCCAVAVCGFRVQPTSVRCRHACPPGPDASDAGSGGELVSPEVTGALPRALRQAERRPDPATRVVLVLLSRVLDWRPLLTVGQPDTLIRWHRRGWRFFWRSRSRPGRPPISRDLQRLIVSMAQANPIWGEERIANELRLKLNLTVSPRRAWRSWRCRVRHTGQRDRPVRPGAGDRHRSDARAGGPAGGGGTGFLRSNTRRPRVPGEPASRSRSSAGTGRRRRRPRGAAYITSPQDRVKRSAEKWNTTGLAGGDS
jgi:hypothetical protein